MLECCKTVNCFTALFLLFEQNIGGIISHNRRKSWLVLHILKDIYPFAQTFRLRRPECWDSIKSWNCFYRETIKAIPLKVFERWGAGKKNFFKKFSSPRNSFATAPF